MMRCDRRTLLQSILGSNLIAGLLHSTTQAIDPLSNELSSTPFASSTTPTPPNEDGYELWLRYRPVTDTTLLQHYRAAITKFVISAHDPIRNSIKSELTRACAGMLDRKPAESNVIDTDGVVLIATPASFLSIRHAIDFEQFSALGEEGFILKSTAIDGYATTVITANTDRGLLYGVFAFIKQMQLREPIDSLDHSDIPRANNRLVNHWDDMDRTVTRGYAGLSIFHFADLTMPNPRYIDYARLLASIGINGTVINDVNADSAFLDSKMIPGYASLAGIFRAWGIRLFLSVNFASPVDLTTSDANPITTADPFDPGVQHWWKAKIDEIYRAIPDFGGFLVKANSEGEPGPLTYHRTHADGANMLARPLAAHNGLLIWRSFVHQGFRGWAEFEYRAFHPLDGQFDKNVIIQTKNGPIDFQPREPVNPLFGGLPKTNQMIELQITQEYTGHATHLCFLPAYWSLVLGFDTYMAGVGPTVSEIVDGSAHDRPYTGFAGVINFGDDRNWTGSYLAAANTYGFARLAWGSSRPVDDLATEWTRLTFGIDDRVVSTIALLLEASWETYLDYTSPFGVGYLMRPTGAHYLPDPRGTQHQSHFTDSKGSGYDRTVATGTGFTRLYSDYWYDRYERLETCPEDLMMFMHVVPWDHKLIDGATTIQQMYDDHFTGVENVRRMQTAWQSLAGRIDEQRFDAITRQFERQLFESRVWRDVLVSYYFDYARIVSTSKPWIQLEIGQSPTLLFGGANNELTVQVANATTQTQSLRLSIDQSQGNWTSNTIERKLESRESATLTLDVIPPIEPYLGGVVFAREPGAIQGIGFDTQTVIVTPSPQQCSVALDIGVKPDSVVPGYTSLTSVDMWADSSTAGWTGKPPQDTWMGANWGLLQNHCASGSTPHTLRVRLPAGKQRAWALVGGEGSGTQPVRIRMGNDILIQTGYLEENAFRWESFMLDGGSKGKTVDLTIEGIDGRQWRLSALVVLKPGL